MITEKLKNCNKVMALEFVMASIVLLALPAQVQPAKCYSKMTGTTGTFSSPRYPQDYPSNSFCEYTIRCPSDSYIEITFTNFKLERPSQGEMTDYITIVDGGSKNQQNVTYDGTQSAPFMFRSKTRKLLITFRSNGMFVYSGFRATYRHVKKCKPITIQHGKVDCDVNKADLASHCNVTCDEKFVLDGEKLVQCIDAKFPNKPTCVVRPEYACNSENFRNIFKKTSKTWWITLETCVKNGSTGEISKCNYECAKNYVDTGNGVIECVDGVIEQEAQCLPDPDVIAKCLESQNSSDCPIDDQQGFTARMEEDSKELKELPDLGRAAAKNLRRYRCDRQVCRRLRSGRYYWGCNKYASICQLVFRESTRKRKLRRQICGGCQSKGCRGSNIFDIFFRH